jgi:two-component system sensor histidine kinase/response regulator
MTANAMQSDRDLCQAAGMNDFVVKPIEPELLWRALARWTRPRDGLGHQASALQPTIRAERRRPRPDRRKEQHADSTLPIQIPHDIAGLDTQLGLRHAMGKHELYLSLLTQFVRSHQDALQPIRQAMLQGDLATAERLAHTLKSVAANIGARPLHDDMEQLENALRDGTTASQCLLLLDAPAVLLAQLISQLQACLPAARPIAVVEQFDPAELSAVCRDLRGLLAYDNPDAADLIQEYAPMLRSALGDSLRKLQSAVDAFDFPAALSALDEGVAQAGIQL